MTNQGKLLTKNQDKLTKISQGMFFRAYLGRPLDIHGLKLSFCRNVYLSQYCS